MLRLDLVGSAIIASLAFLSADTTRRSYRKRSLPRRTWYIPAALTNGRIAVESWSHPFRQPAGVVDCSDSDSAFGKLDNSGAIAVTQ